MPNSMPSSNSSSTCRIDWRPSRWLAAALLALGMIAALSLWLGALPMAVKLVAMPLALAEGARLARRHLAAAPLAVDWLGGDEPAFVTGPMGVIHLENIVVRFRGPLATLAGTDPQGRVHRLAWWPDTVDAAGRRQLRLAASVSCRSAKPLRKQAA
jgi:toxin CptA